MKKTIIFLISLFLSIPLAALLAQQASSLNGQVITNQSATGNVLQSELASTSSSFFSATLRVGSNDILTNNQVSALQKCLAKDSAIYPEGFITGRFGPLTEKAVQRWQAKNGIISSGDYNTTGYGLVGPKTRKALNAACFLKSDPGQTTALKPKALTVLSPNGGEIWQKGALQTIRWSLSGSSISSHASISLISYPNCLLNIPCLITEKLVDAVYTITQSTMNDGEYVWKVGNLEMQKPGFSAPDGTYRIRVYDLGLNQSDLSDNSFQVVSTKPVSPIISSLDLQTGLVGSQVIVNGLNFVPNQNTVKFGNGYLSNIPSQDGKTLQFVVPEGLTPCLPGASICPQLYQQVTPGDYPVSIINDAGTSNSAIFKVIAPSSAKFNIGDRVETTDRLVVRESPAGIKLGVQPLGSQGIILEGPNTANFRTWWKIDYDKEPDGWSVETWLKKIRKPPSLGKATLSWKQNTEADLASYKIYYGTSSRIGICPLGGYSDVIDVGLTSNQTAPSYTISNLIDNQTYYFSITAYDTSKNESCFSSEVSLTIK